MWDEGHIVFHGQNAEEGEKDDYLIAKVDPTPTLMQQPFQKV